MNRFTTWVRDWLGINVLSVQVYELWKDHSDKVKALNTLHKQRHDEILKKLDALASSLDEVNKRITIQRLDQPPDFTEPSLDWDTVQQMALHQMEKEPR